MRQVAVATCLAAAALLVSSCASGHAKPSEPAAVALGPSAPAGEATAVPLLKGAKIPKFSGPYAGEFERAYKHSTSDLQRDVLRDGRISDREMAALDDAFAQCLTGYGYTSVKFDGKGGLRGESAQAAL